MSRVHSFFTDALIGGFVCIAGIPPVAAATVRPHVFVSRTTVALSDLFNGLEPGQDCDLGSAPVPGRRMIILSAQLNAIAAQYGVDLQQMSETTSVIIERRARIVKAAELIAVLRPALISGGASGNSEITLGAFATPTVPAEFTAPAEVQALEFDSRTARFTATLAFNSQDTDPVTVRVTGRAEPMLDVVTADRDLPAGSLLSAMDVRIAHVRASTLHGAVPSSPADVVGLTLRQPVAAGSTIATALLVRAPLVDRGRPVVLRLRDGGLLLTATGVAIESGTAGDRIHVINTTSRAMLVGEVTGSSEVQIDPGTGPSSAAPGSSFGLPRINSGSFGTQSQFVQEARYP